MFYKILGAHGQEPVQISAARQDRGSGSKVLGAVARRNPELARREGKDGSGNSAFAVTGVVFGTISVILIPA
jgi:hypothetical protein